MLAFCPAKPFHVIIFLLTRSRRHFDIFMNLVSLLQCSTVPVLLYNRGQVKIIFYMFNRLQVLTFNFEHAQKCQIWFNAPPPSSTKRENERPATTSEVCIFGRRVLPRILQRRTLLGAQGASQDESSSRGPIFTLFSRGPIFACWT